jgi:hypothetical protein
MQPSAAGSVPDVTDAGVPQTGAGADALQSAAGPQPSAAGAGVPSLTGAEPRTDQACPSRARGAALGPADHAHEDDVDLDGEPGPEYWGHVKLPFGPFLALGALEFLFFGDAAIDTWLRLFS